MFVVPTVYNAIEQWREKRSVFKGLGCRNGGDGVYDAPILM
jgi:hypothetical protein